jgi:predicted ATPase
MRSFSAHLAARARHAHPPAGLCATCAAHLQQALELYRGRFLAEFFLEDSADFEAWALAQREALHQQALAAAADLAGYSEQHGDLAATRRYATRQLELDPWNEPAHRQLVRALAGDGQRAAALAQYETCRRVLAEELGIEPSRETRELYEQVRAGTWAPAAEGARPPAPSHLPAQLTPFVGRERELDDLRRLLADPACRCLTLVGPGGIGKTRLAIEAASHLPAGFAEGVYFVPLASVESARLIAPAIADAIGFAFQGASQADPQAQLFSYLRAKQALLVTDNLEQLVAEPGIAILAELLAHAPHVKLLATSRESLGLPGEWIFEVQGLPVPNGADAGESTANASVELFLQRARRAHARFQATADDYPAIARICRLVDGMPLGIELAATWVRTLACDEIAREIERGLDFLSVPVRELPARHRSLRAVFDHSWRLLAEGERRILLRLSVFRGGFRREAAEAIAAATLSVLSTLLTKSLVRRSGAGRYDLHELIQQFAAEHLSERREEQAAAQAQHGRYYLKFFTQADGRLRSGSQREALAELTAEMDNFRTAWEWAVAQGEFALIEPALHTLAYFYDTRGWLQDGLDTFGRAVAALETAHGPLPPDRTGQIALGHLLAARALLASRAGQYEQAQGMLERSLAILRAANEPRVLVEAITFLGMAMDLTGNYGRALELYTEGLEVARSIGDRWFAALCHTCQTGLVGVTHLMIEPEIAHERLRSVVVEWRAIGDPRMTAMGLNLLSWNALTLGRYAEALAAIEESAELSRSVGDRYALGFAYRGRGIVAQVQGQHQQAVDLFHQSLDTLTELGARQDVARLLAEMGRSLFALGDDTEAGRVWREALHLALETRGAFIALEALAGLARLQAKHGAREQALEWLLVVVNHPSSIQDTKDRAERLRGQLEAQLTSQQVEAAQARAGAKTLEALAEAVLRQ